jgi:hypothetical protein
VRPGEARQAVADRSASVHFPHLRPGRYAVEWAGRPAGDLELTAGAEHEAVLTAGPDGAPSVSPLRVRLRDGRTALSAEDLGGGPRPADPWSLLRGVPGVIVDRVDVGGSETAQQSLIVSHGDPGGGTTWTLDGVDVTDPAAVGATSFFPDVDALAGVQVRTGAWDVRVRTPGVQVEMSLPEPAPGLHGRAHLRHAGDPLQSANLPAALQGRPFFRNRTEHVWDGGGDLGGPLAGDRLWVWGSASRRTLRQETFTEHEERLRLTTFSGKAALRLGAGRLSLLAARSEKVHEERDSGFGASPESRWRQSGPANVLALEDRRDLAGVSWRAGLSYLDAGFRLDPQGGSGPSAYEDFRGVFQRSYSDLETVRPRLQAGLEGERALRALGLAHVVRGGVGYRRSRVTTASAWPGNQVLGLERQNVFFRTFQLTGFALPTRAQESRSVHDHLEAHVQDDFRRGPFTVTLGLRLDRLSGRNLPSSVPANPELPGELPAVRYDGGPVEIRWTDVLPRAGVAWASPRHALRLGYAAYGAALGSGEVTFDNPLGQIASLTYYWLDRNGDHVVQAGELDRVRGRLGASGVDPAQPAAARSPHRIDPGLRAPRTHEVSAAAERTLGTSGRAAVAVSWRRLTRPLWRPLQNLTLADYAIRGAATGRLFGEEYRVGYYAPASQSRIAPGNGRVLANRAGYHQDAWNFEATVDGRWPSWLRGSAWVALSDWREFFPDPQVSLQDPTSTEGEPLQDAGALAVRAGGLGRSDVFVNARWTAGLAARASLPWSLQASALVHAREGFPIPYFVVADTGDPTGGAKNVLVSPHLDSYRLPAVVLVDVGLSRALHAGPGSLTVGVDVFNVLNRATVLQVARDLELPAFDRPRELMRPRVARVSLSYRF